MYHSLSSRQCTRPRYVPYDFGFPFSALVVRDHITIPHALAGEGVKIVIEAGRNVAPCSEHGV